MSKKENKSDIEIILESSKKSLQKRKEIIDAIKNEGRKAWSIECGPYEFITKTLSRQEYSKAMFEDIDQDSDFDEILDDRSMRILEYVCVYPENWKEIVQSGGGYLATIVEEVLKNSGFTAYSKEL